MAKSATNKTVTESGTAIDRSPRRRPGRSVEPTVSDIAARAYALYLERGGEDGHDVEDWLRAERELRRALSGSAA